MFGIIKNGYTLKLKNFEGPLDLLTELIGEAKLNITDILLSNITDQYLQYLKTMQLFNIDLASEFFVVAATLVYIKTKKLLPIMQEDEEELLDEKELIERLREYKKFRFLARELERILQSGSIYYPRGAYRHQFGLAKSDQSLEMTVGDLINVLKRYKGSFIRKAIPLKRREVKVEEKMIQILKLLNNKNIIRFSELILENKNKIDTIASFLGSVELSFRQEILLKQLKLFADIELKKREDRSMK